MDKYQVKLMSKAHRDLDGIYAYNAQEFKASETAATMADALDNAILGLDERCLIEELKEK